MNYFVSIFRSLLIDKHRSSVSIFAFTMLTKWQIAFFFFHVFICFLHLLFKVFFSYTAFSLDDADLSLIQLWLHGIFYMLYLANFFRLDTVLERDQASPIICTGRVRFICFRYKVEGCEYYYSDLGIDFLHSSHFQSSNVRSIPK